MRSRCSTKWYALDTAGVVEHRIRGTHRSILREPDVTGLAGCISELVETALDRPKPGRAGR